jgi:hypothetical protein
MRRISVRNGCEAPEPVGVAGQHFRRCAQPRQLLKPNAQLADAGRESKRRVRVVFPIVQNVIAQHASTWVLSQDFAGGDACSFEQCDRCKLVSFD